MSHRDILDVNGSIAQSLPNYEARPQQLQMAEAVARALGGPGHLMVEAGTGVGKSFAYLVPAIQKACATKDYRVVISTHTISLQEQLIRKDIPFLQNVMPEKFAALLVKGRGNYLSKRRLKVAHERSLSLLTEPGAIEQLDTLMAWNQTTRDGSRSDLDFRPMPAVWELVESDSSNCLGKKCKDYNDCFYYQARRNIQNAKILVVNHALFFTDLAFKALKPDGGVLPKYNAVIFDEAHTLEDVAAEHMGLSITRGQADYLLNRLFVERKGKAIGLLAVHGDAESWVQVNSTRRTVNLFFNGLLDWRTRQLLSPSGRGAGGEGTGASSRALDVGQPPHPQPLSPGGERGERGRPLSPGGERGGGRPLSPGGERGGGFSDSMRIRQSNIVLDILSDEFKKLAIHIERIENDVKRDEEKIELEAASLRCRDFAARIEAWLGQQLPGQVYWMQGAGERGNKLELASAPIEVNEHFREKLFGRIPSVIMTSATLSVGGSHGFDFFKERLGFPPEAPAVQLGSPFDYRRQAELHLFQAMPDPTSATRKFEEACIAKIQDYVQRTQGRAFVLFTSNLTLQRTADQLRSWLRTHGLTLISQSDGMPANRMLETFRDTERAVLFGVDSFWQGVDVQGEALSNVIITKLPFTPPDRPLVEARCDAIAERGGQPFLDYTLPQAILKLKQGFGRLIRTKSDTGMVVILDPRMVTKPYGRRFLEGLPDCRRFVDGMSVDE